MPPELAFVHRVARRMAIHEAGKADRDGDAMNLFIAEIEQRFVTGLDRIWRRKVSRVGEREELGAEHGVRADNVNDGGVIDVFLIEEAEKFDDGRGRNG